MADIQKERAARVEDAYRLLQGNKDSLGNIPGILRQLISLRVWEGYNWRGKMITFGTFREFVECSPPEGLGTTVEELISFCRKYPEIADLIDQVVQEQAPEYLSRQHANNKHASKRPSGTAFQRSIRRLRTLATQNQKAKNLYEQFLRGEISANYALRELGKRKARYGVEASAESVVNFVKGHLTKGEIKKVITALEKEAK